MSKKQLKQLDEIVKMLRAMKCNIGHSIIPGTPMKITFYQPKTKVELSDPMPLSEACQWIEGYVIGTGSKPKKK